MDIPLTPARPRPRPRPRPRHNGWTPDKQSAFIAILAYCGSVRSACEHLDVDVSTSSAYQLRRHPSGRGFAKAWDAALGAAMARLHDVAMERAMRGQRQAVYYHDEVVGQRTVYDNKLLMFMLSNRGWLANRRFGETGMPAYDRAGRIQLPANVEEDSPKRLPASPKRAQIPRHRVKSVKFQRRTPARRPYRA